LEVGWCERSDSNAKSFYWLVSVRAGGGRKGPGIIIGEK
jgi:hypothetical protein